jgi:hypothetical protein
MFQTIRSVLLKPRTVLIIYILMSIVAGVQMIMEGNSPFAPTQNTGIISDIVNTPEVQKYFIGHYVTNYNNYVIFKCSFSHLVHGLNLYALHPSDHWDLFKYSPSFALFMGFFAWAPDYIGLCMWLILNAVVLYAAISMLPFNDKTRALLLWFMGMELLTSMQNCQSNGLLCGLMIAGYCFMQKGKNHWAALMLVMATFIKIYGGAAFCLFLFFPDKVKLILYSVLWTLVLFFIPIVATPLHTLIWQYHNWWVMMAADQSVSYGVSILGWLHSWFHFDAKMYIMLAGIAFFVLPFIRLKLYKNEVYRLLTLAAILIWLIIFNHKAESATYIIAVTGVGIWYFSGPPKLWRNMMLWTVFVFTCLSFTDIFPGYIKHNIIQPYCIKAVPCIVLWCIIMAELMLMKSDAVLYKTTKAEVAA